MPRHNVTTTQAQERALLALLAVHNKRLTSSIPPGLPLTADQFFELRADALLAQIVAEGDTETKTEIVRALKAAIDGGDSAKINAVKLALGL